MATRSRAAAKGGARASPACPSRSIFLTVGTTSFDALVAAVDDAAFVAAASARGYTSLTVQARGCWPAPDCASLSL